MPDKKHKGGVNRRNRVLSSSLAGENLNKAYDIVIKNAKQKSCQAIKDKVITIQKHHDQNLLRSLNRLK